MNLPDWGRAKDMSTSAAAKRPRPKYLSLTALLFEIRLPASAWVSGMHRISGALLFFPFAAWLLYLLDTSLASEQGYHHVRSYLAMPVAKIGLLVFIWAYAHHFCAGIRFLLLDLNKGIGLRPARVSSYAVFAVSLALTALFGWRIW
jgi:succinate dehydrogenase / fumarate reductase cytochrome b subunit